MIPDGFGLTKITQRLICEMEVSWINFDFMHTQTSFSQISISFAPSSVRFHVLTLKELAQEAISEGEKENRFLLQ